MDMSHLSYFVGGGINRNTAQTFKVDTSVSQSPIDIVKEVLDDILELVIQDTEGGNNGQGAIR